MRKGTVLVAAALGGDDGSKAWRFAGGAAVVALGRAVEVQGMEVGEVSFCGRSRRATTLSGPLWW